MAESRNEAWAGIRRRRRRRMPTTGHLDRWMVSYADFVTLLFAFFTTLYAISKVDAAKLATMATSMNKAFESRESNKGRGAVQPRISTAQGGVPSEKDVDVEAELVKRLAGELKDGRVSVDVDGRGVVISLLESGSFPLGSADLTPEAREVLSKLAATIAPLDTAVRIEGHTDDVPIHTPRFASNWELSTARATSVVQYLISAGGVPASRLSASGYGEYHPKATNDSAENRTRNRRVDLVVLNPVTRRAEEPPVPSSPHAESPRESRP